MPLQINLQCSPFLLAPLLKLVSRVSVFNNLFSLLQWGLSLASFWDSTSLCESLQELHRRVQHSWDILKGYDHGSSSDIDGTNVDCAPLQLHSGVRFLVCLTFEKHLLGEKYKMKSSTDRETKNANKMQRKWHHKNEK